MITGMKKKEKVFLVMIDMFQDTEESLKKTCQIT